MKNKRNFTHWYIAMYSLFCLYLPSLILPRSLLTLQHIIGETVTDLIYTQAKMSEHMMVPFIGYCIIFVIFMLFFACKIKTIGLEKTVLIVFSNVILPIILLSAQSNGLFRLWYIFAPETFYALIALAVVVIIVSLTISAALKVSENEKAIEA